MIHNFQQFNEAKKAEKNYKKLLNGLKKCVQEYGNTGFHYEDGEVEELQEELLKEYPEYKKEIDKIFDLMGDVSNNMHELENDGDDMSDKEYRDLEKESEKLENKAKEILKKLKEKLNA